MAAASGQSMHRRPRLLCLVVLAVSAATVLRSWSFCTAGSAAGHVANRLRAGSSKVGAAPSLALQAAAGVEVPAAQEEMSDFDKFIDRWNTKGGLLIATVLLTAAFYVLYEVVLLVPGLETDQAGVVVSFVSFIVLMAWTSTYLVRVGNKKTTYATQLKVYEQEIMMRRLSELDEDELEALCEEVGVSDQELEGVVGMEKMKVLSTKEKVLEMFKINKEGMASDIRGF
mmetsp:Transcript_75530/g.245617  ORF Transcript_75530/g.245617 Transcript_75530/m.245617 type:complete len:228 (-) Transcript_75530:61-744(-)